MLLLFFTVPHAFSQITPYIARITVPSSVDEKKPASVSVELTPAANARQVFLYFRRFGESDFQRTDMLAMGSTFAATIEPDFVSPPYIEYFIAIVLPDRIETYPVSNPDANPQKIVVNQRDVKDDEVRFLSPRPGETVAAEEFNVVISLYYASDEVNKRATKLYVDGVDVSKQGAILSEDMIIYSPPDKESFRLGTRSIKVELFDSTGKLYHTVQQTFTVSTVAAMEEERARLQYMFDGQAEARAEEVDSLSTTFLRGDIRSRNSYSGINFGFNMHLDNQEKDTRQPQNRYTLYGETSFLRLQVGDAYPAFPSLIVSGKRVRGVSGALRLGFFNLDVSAGETERVIAGRLDSVVVDTSGGVSSRPINSKLLTDTSYAVFTPGVFARDFIAVRPSFGSGENFQLGLTYMKSKDRISSLEYGITPQENLVAGADMLVAFDDERVRWDSQVSLSVQNTDISGGSFTQADFDSLKKQDEQAGKDLEDLAKIADKFITVNDNIFPTNPISKGLPGIAYETALSLNYFNNFLRAVAFRRGAAYKSFGNDFLQSDLTGFQVSDRMRLFSNRVFLSLSYEGKSDNTADTKEATTSYSNFNSTLSLSLGPDIPTFSVGYGYNTRVSDKYLYRIGAGDSTLKADDKTNRIFVAAGYDFTYGARHSANFTLSTSNLKDATFYKRDQQNMNLQLSVISMFSDMPLQTSVSFTISNNENTNQVFITSTADSVGADSVLTKTTFNYSSVSVGAQYSVMENKVRLLGAITPIFGDFNRTSLTTGADYYITDNHAVEFRFDYILNKGRSSDLTTSLIYRFNF